MSSNIPRFGLEPEFLRAHEPADLARLAPADLVTVARRRGVHFHLPPHATPHNPSGRLMIWNSRTPEGLCVVEAMRARRGEIAAWLRDHTLPPVVFSTDERRFRTEILMEPDSDIPIAELPWSVMACLIHTEVWRAMDAWWDEHEGRDRPAIEQLPGARRRVPPSLRKAVRL